MNKIKIKKKGGRVKFRCQKGQSTLEYALVTIVAVVISTILIAVGRPYIVDIIAKVFDKIASIV